jgi:hypothetical protein
MKLLGVWGVCLFDIQRFVGSGLAFIVHRVPIVQHNCLPADPVLLPGFRFAPSTPQQGDY